MWTRTARSPGEAVPGTYTLIYRTPGMEKDKEADKLENVKVTAGQDVAADVDMSRKEYIDALPVPARSTGSMPR